MIYNVNVPNSRNSGMSPTLYMNNYYDDDLHIPPILFILYILIY